MNDRDDGDDDVDGKIFYQVMESGDYYGHLNDDRNSYGRPYKFQVLKRRKRKMILTEWNSQSVLLGVCARFVTE